MLLPFLLFPATTIPTCLFLCRRSDMIGVITNDDDDDDADEDDDKEENDDDDNEATDDDAADAPATESAFVTRLNPAMLRTSLLPRRTPLPRSPRSPRYSP